MFYAIHYSENNGSMDHPPCNQTPHPSREELGCIEVIAVQRGRPRAGAPGPGFPLALPAYSSRGELHAARSAAAVCLGGGRAAATSAPRLPAGPMGASPMARLA